MKTNVYIEYNVINNTYRGTDDEGKEVFNNMPIDTVLLIYAHSNKYRLRVKDKETLNNIQYAIHMQNKESL